MLRWLPALLLFGCSQVPLLPRTPQFDQEAILSVWADSYGMPAPPPPVLFRDTPECSLCDDPGCDGLLQPGGGCGAGWCEVSPLDGSSTAVVLYQRRYSNSVLSHELLHSKVGLVGPKELVGDPGHTLPLWNDGTQEAADRLLRDRGL